MQRGGNRRGHFVEVCRPFRAPRMDDGEVMTKAGFEDRRDLMQRRIENHCVKLVDHHATPEETKVTALFRAIGFRARDRVEVFPRQYALPNALKGSVVRLRVTAFAVFDDMSGVDLFGSGELLRVGVIVFAKLRQFRCLHIAAPVLYEAVEGETACCFMLHFGKINSCAATVRTRGARRYFFSEPGDFFRRRHEFESTGLLKEQGALNQHVDGFIPQCQALIESEFLPTGLAICAQSAHLCPDFGLRDGLAVHGDDFVDGRYRGCLQVSLCTPHAHRKGGSQKGKMGIGMKKSLLLLATCALSATAADVTGKWIFETNVLGNRDTVECTFRQTETRLSGTCKGEQFPEASATGGLTDDNFQIAFVYLFAGQSFNCTYRGKLTGTDSLAGSIVVSGVDGVTGEFKAKKQ
jgi:hypothetical protein